METGALTGSIDVAQVVLYVFWLFFFSLIFWLRREDRREGYPCEGDMTGRVEAGGPIMMAKPKTFKLPEGGTYTVPNDDRDHAEYKGERTANFVGSPLVPVGDPMLAGMGPAAFCQRADHPELTRDGDPLIVPLRALPDYSVVGTKNDVRGRDVVAADGEVAGKVVDIWMDRADVMVRYLEVELPAEGGRRLLPMPLAKVTPAAVKVRAVKAHHFAQVPVLAQPEQVTLQEEEKIGAYFAGGRLYADPSRVEPLV